MKKSLKILMVLHMPWDRNLGGSRVQLELAEEFSALGHEVEKFDYHDAFPEDSQPPWGKFFPSALSKLLYPSFALKAKEFVQANSHRFDIIDAHQYNLPYSKQALGFKGLLVARSVGLMPLAEEFAQQEEKHNKNTLNPKKILLKFLISRIKRRDLNYFLPSLQACDLINVPNQDELIYVRDQLGLGHKCTVFPFGLSKTRQIDFREASQSSQLRFTKKQVAFIGYWSPRKGTRDWQDIIRRIRGTIPEANFLFLGTGISSEAVFHDLKLPPCDWIKVIPSYESHELPNLLSQATIGAFPSYMEGFGFAVLEKLASGLPTVAYDVPGPREMLQYLSSDCLIQAGNVEAFSHKIIDLLSLESQAYTTLSRKCFEVAKQFEWHNIAKQHLEVYQKYLLALSS